MTVAPPAGLCFVCPRCGGDLDVTSRAYRCAGCPAEYPVVAGIADFRVAPDPWIGLEEDRAKALRLEEVTEGMGFEEAVRTYWDLTPGTPRERVARFIMHALSAEARSREWLALVDDEEGDAPGGPWLDLGCGTGDLVVVGAARGGCVVGVDIALRWLVVARRRPVLGDGARQLVCACAERLPFPNRAFARVLSLGMLEHCTDPGAALAEAHRVLQPGGLLRLRTVNRFSLLAEPHVGVWGVGLMPRRWADRYVQWRNGGRYLHHRPLSRRELVRDLRRAGFADARVDAAPVLNAERHRLGPAAYRAAPLYDRLRRAPVLGGVLAAVAPVLEARGMKR